VKVRTNGGSFVPKASTDDGLTGILIMDEFPGVANDRTAWSSASIDLSSLLPAQTMDVWFNGWIEDGINNLDDGFTVDDVNVSCVSSCPIKETYRQRPDQSHDADGNGNNIDMGDYPSGW
jgi:hypothetical protein